MDNWELEERQKLPLDIKINMTKERIKEWYNHFDGKVYVSFSGGKDSTVLLDIVRSVYPDVVGVFVDTGLEYPEIRSFVKTVDNVIWLKPKMSFRDVIKKHGYPVISKEQSCAISRYRNTKDIVQKYRRLNGWPKGKKGMISKKWQYLITADFKISDACCDKLKKNPLKLFAKKSGKHPMMGMMAGESRNRQMMYLKNGCNGFEMKSPVSWPIAFWSEKDIWDYIKTNEIAYSKIYDMGYDRTGCMFCMFGVHFEDNGNNRFHKMKKTHPKQYKYCIEKLGIGEVLDFMNIDYNGRYEMMFGEDNEEMRNV